MLFQALADYMESKRRAFPRFYFVSAADLLDILSNGSSPHRIMQHMSKCFQVRLGWMIGAAKANAGLIVLRHAMPCNGMPCHAIMPEVIASCGILLPLSTGH